MEFMTYIFQHDQSQWCGFPKEYPDYQAHGESFEELQLKLHRLRLDLNHPTSSSACSNAALLSWYWQRRMSGIHY